MGNITFPDHVVTFIEAIDRYLGFHDTKLGEFTEDIENESRTYQIATGGGAVELVVHRTSWSFERPVGEYRARVIADVAPEIAAVVRGAKNLINRYATLGALLVTEQKTSVSSQCMIPLDHSETLAGVLATAIVYSRGSIINGVGHVLDPNPSFAVGDPSAWTDLDFEQIHYDYAHLGVGTLAHRSWTMRVFPFGIISLDAVHNNPYWGGGLLVRSRVPKEVLGGQNGPFDANDLNLLDYAVSDVPMFGGWCEDGDDVVFVQFMPNLIKAADSTDLTVAWARRRVCQVLGLARDAVEAGKA